MIGRTNGSGTGGGGTILKVTSASSIPASGKPGQIVVVSSATCKYYEYGLTEPTQRQNGDPLEAGDVFIKAGSQGPLAITKRGNAISLGLDCAYRRVGTAWVRSKASYFDTSWHEFSTERMYILKDGVLGDGIAWNASSSGKINTKQPSDDFIQMNYGDGSIQYIELTNAISCSGFTKMYFDFDASVMSGYLDIGYSTSGTMDSTFTAKLSYGYNRPAAPSERSSAYISVEGATSIYLKIVDAACSAKIYNIWFE